MTEMASASGAEYLRALHPEAAVLREPEMRLVKRRRETGPTGAGLEFLPGPKERQAAKSAAVCPRLLVIEQGAAERSFRSMLQKDMALLRRQRRLQFAASIRIRGRQVESR